MFYRNFSTAIAATDASGFASGQVWIKTIFDNFDNYRSNQTWLR